MLPMPHRVTIRRAVFTNVSGENIPGTPTDAATGVRCRIEESHGSTVVTATGLSRKYHAIGFFKPNIDIRPSATGVIADELLVTKPTTGPTYRVLSVADEAGTGHHLVAKLERVGT